ncbi:hypothetical protein ACFX11_025719 [Malus domestica]
MAGLSMHNLKIGAIMETHKRQRSQQLTDPNPKRKIMQQIAKYFEVVFNRTARIWSWCGDEDEGPLLMVVFVATVSVVPWRLRW